jgi:hypothetical protein
MGFISNDLWHSACKVSDNVGSFLAPEVVSRKSDIASLEYSTYWMSVSVETGS